ncbi:MAG: cadherin-like domain-containing protein [Kofleriaceae bacterium]
MRFVALRSNLAPILLLSAAGCGEVVPPNIEAPVNATNAGTVDEGGTLALAEKLVSADVDNTNDELVYTVHSVPLRGMVVRDGAALVVGDTFTQEEVNDGKVSYVNDGSEDAADEFTWALSDGLHTIPETGTSTFAITISPVNDPPHVVNNPLSTIPEAGFEVLTAARLQSDDIENDAVTYTLVTTSRGQLELDSGTGFVALALNGTFSQQDIIDGKVRFVDSGVDDAALAANTNTSASFNWSVADVHGAVTPATGSNASTFTITPVDDEVTPNWRAQRCASTGTNVVANPLVSITDPDSPPVSLADYQICVVSIGGGTHVTPSTTGSPGTTVTIVPTLQNGAVNLTVGSCVQANALSGLNLDSTANSNRGSVTWKLMRSGVQVGNTGTVQFPVTPTSC